MQDTSLTIMNSGMVKLEGNLPCELVKAYYDEKNPENASGDHLFLWLSEIISQKIGEYMLETRLKLDYILPKNPHSFLSLFGAKPQENDLNQIGLELTIRNPTKDPNMLEKIISGTVSLGGDLYFIGDQYGASFGHYDGEDLRLSIRQMLTGRVIFGIPMFGKGESFWGGGIPRTVGTSKHKTPTSDGLQEYLRKTVPNLVHRCGEYSLQLPIQLQQRERLYFNRHLELIHGFLGLEYSSEK